VPRPQPANSSGPQTEPAQHGKAAEVIGSFHYAVLSAHEFDRQPRVLNTWLVTMRDACATGRVFALLGGAPPSGHDGQMPCVITDATEVDVLLNGPKALDVGWHRQHGHVCDGIIQQHHRDSRPCACPPTLTSRRTATRAGVGCRPRAQVCFRLLQDPALGTFTFSTGNWTFAEQVSNALDVLHRDPHPTCARLSLQRTPCRLQGGTIITYTRPELELIRAGSFAMRR
jgi:hypothetical protein